MVHHYAANHRSRKWAATRLPLRRRQGGYLRRRSEDAETAFEDAMLGFEMYWYGSPTIPMGMHLSSPMFHLGWCELLGATNHGRFLVLERDPARAEIPKSCWWELL